MSSVPVFILTYQSLSSAVSFFHSLFLFFSLSLFLSFNISLPSCQVSQIYLPYRSCSFIHFFIPSCCLFLSFSLSLFLSFSLSLFLSFSLSLFLSFSLSLFLSFSLSTTRLRHVKCPISQPVSQAVDRASPESVLHTSPSLSIAHDSL